MMQAPNIVGSTFGHWTVLEDGLHVGQSRGVRARCICGKEKLVNRSHLVAGRSTSCGCIADAAFRKRATRHGLTNSTEYRSWCHMVQRCTNQKNRRWPLYGARGICVHPDWLGPGGFDRFLEHVGRKPTPQHQIDRIDNDGNYEPGNVRWATSKEQNRNRRDSHLVAFHGEVMALSALAERTGINASTLGLRLGRGLTVEEAVTHPRYSRGGGR